MAGIAAGNYRTRAGARVASPVSRRGLPRQLQGADASRRRLRAQRELAGDRRRHRGRGPGRHGRDQPLARRGGDRAEPRHRRPRPRRRGRGGGRAGRRRRERLRGPRRRFGGSPGSAASAITAAAESHERAVHLVLLVGRADAAVAAHEAGRDCARRVDVLSSVPRREGLWASLSGTSMASPHVAGAAALLRQRHRGWTVEQIKSALVLTGKPVLAPGGVEADTTREGGGTDRPRARGPRRSSSRRLRAFVRLRRARRLLGPAGRALRRGRRSRRLDREHDAPAARQRCDGVRAAGGDRPGPARRHGNSRAGSGRGDAHRLRRPPARRGPPADPVLVPRRGAEARPARRRHRSPAPAPTRATRAGTRRWSTRTAIRTTRGTRRLAHAARAGAGLPGLG